MYKREHSEYYQTMPTNTIECPRTPVKPLYRVTYIMMDGGTGIIELDKQTVHTYDVLTALYKVLGSDHRYNICAHDNTDSADSTTTEDFLSTPDYVDVPSKTAIYIDNHTDTDQFEIHGDIFNQLCKKDQRLLLKAQREENKPLSWKNSEYAPKAHHIVQTLKF